MKTFSDYSAACLEAVATGEEVYRMESGSYAVVTADEADELMEAGINLEPTEDNNENPDMGIEDDIDPPQDEWYDESMDGDHESALASVYGDNSGDWHDIDDYNGPTGWDE